MNTQLTEDTLFLSTQAENIWHLNTALLGKVAIELNEIAADSIVFLSPGNPLPESALRHVRAVICTHDNLNIETLSAQTEIPIIVVSEKTIFSQGDVITISERGRIHRLFRASSRNNALLVTEVCNNLCVMCPQPPKPESEINHGDNEQRILKTLALIDDKHFPETLCITGGEPTMLNEGLLNIIEAISDRNQQTLIHLLTNGRYLSQESYTARLAQKGHHQLLAGIPLFGHVSEIHDYVVQCEGAFNQTMAGLLNCYRYGIDIELRVVLNKITVKYLSALAEFISRNLFFVKHIALMGMENMGYAKLNREAVFIDPWEYKDMLSDTIEIFQLYGIDVRVFNLPLCIVNEDTQTYCKQSISDFKNSWSPVCNSCVKRDACCGFFSSSTDKFWLSNHISPFVTNPEKKHLSFGG
ncbi:His-Xaa-Ser system radical SAM maturase HxsC [Enterobacter sp. RHBSTW-00175]|uniref:His-Xaa-Ser system radical SAM maturase HxsC n=1 Tax=Enterobacter sp. RHBSTW-00175 TaxID=2742639 RepID=UPI0015E9C2BB|nr:His-Xaa-Ser system radical SAM maturase HxsC [Enterobacter sp. RHBSTW-00175]QMR78120.1 His-Xaa-Ser system radical SAM maturase HxsC [Enterobacter sp. RHBSTW-00175]